MISKNVRLEDTQVHVLEIRKTINLLDIVALQYNLDGMIRYKTNFQQEYQELPRRPNKNKVQNSHVPLYESPLPIEFTKFIHLQEMRPLIHRDYHPFYDYLNHNCTNPSNCSHILSI
ncbi:unnamed protein product [Euphydryas editha]|uniref:Uncharacterized protein n=1 Tax=Euphydryas editha TaxID=104508 RepID=A0AAU9TWF5_EUPED|nr:unnamed protein product [Euphydryas editha]